MSGSGCKSPGRLGPVVKLRRPTQPHISGKDRNGNFSLKRKTIAKRMRAKLQEIKQELRRRMHDPVEQTGKWLKSVMQGYFNYHAVPGNLGRLKVFHRRVQRLWRWALRRRGQPHRPLGSDPSVDGTLATQTACAPSLSWRSLCRQSSKIRTVCANERPYGSVRGCALKARRIQSFETMTAAKLSSQPRTESCVVSGAEEA